MCRLLCYLGEEKSLSSLILKPEHSLEKQAWQPRELREAKLNADGFGFSWYIEHKQSLRAARYRQSIPIWNDPNLAHLANSMKQPLWLAMVRSATPGLGISLQNTQPYNYQQWTFMHNGYLLDFNGETQHRIRDELTDKYLYLINGNTDSEYIFALLMQLLENHSAEHAIIECMDILAEMISNKRALLNIILSDGLNIYATRHAIHGLCPSLYYTNASSEFGAGNQLLVSEKLNNESCWHAIEDNRLIIIKNKEDIGLINL